jgi:hypothetical protein
MIKKMKNSEIIICAYALPHDVVNVFHKKNILRLYALWPYQLKIITQDTESIIYFRFWNQQSGDLQNQITLCKINRSKLGM